MPFDSILQTIGNTPIVRLNRVVPSPSANFFAKLEFMNPGGSIKDRIGIWMIEDAERKGILKPGGTIVEGTSGNTGFGLAIAAAIKGYNCVFVLPDKMSQEKIAYLRSFGARVVVTPTAVEPDDPRSYYSVSRRLAKEIPSAVYLDQYNNLSNRDCHEKTTGPEILRQMPDVDAIVMGIGTGGTTCGIGRFFKSAKPETKIVAVDPIGSLVYEYFKTKKIGPAHTYKIEGIGEDFIPGNYDLSVVDDMVQVEDKESFVMTRELLTKEGIFSGVSSGSAVIGAIKWVKAQGAAMNGKSVLIILPDSGNRYLSKVYNDDWMREAGFLDAPSLGTVADLLKANKVALGGVHMVRETDRLSTVIDTLRDKGISQVPVEDADGWIKGVVTETALLNAVYEGRIHQADPIDSLIDSSIEFVKPSEPIERISHMIQAGKIPLVTDQDHEGKILAIITKIDLLAYLGAKA